MKILLFVLLPGLPMLYFILKAIYRQWYAQVVMVFVFIGDVACGILGWIFLVGERFDRYVGATLLISSLVIGLALAIAIKILYFPNPRFSPSKEPSPEKKA
jgi:hypothetical protein